MNQEGEWRPLADLEMLRARAALLSGIREYFQQAGVLEVETPVCSVYSNTDPALESLTTNYTGPGCPGGGARLYLQTSPEFAMKRLLAAGSGPIFQICKAFRNNESGRLHNPEFTLLEWYRPGFDQHRLMQEVAELVNSLLPVPRPVESLSYGGAFQCFLGVDPHGASAEALRECAMDYGVPGVAELQLDRDGWADLLLTHALEPRLGRGHLTFLYDYPASQAALARIRKDETPVAERFELYLDGMELANGFHELADGLEQQRRFEADNARRREQGKEPLPIDQHLLAALRSGLPDCSGVALGIDRLLMLTTGAAHINEVLAFPVSRA
jgi:lysyl-tRNA synthetase class 2